MEKTKGKRDLVLIVIILSICLISFLALRIINSGPAIEVQISIDGTIVKTLPLDRDADFILDAYESGTNHVVIRNGTVAVTEASCPDKRCVKQGAVHRTGETIVCLPNRTILQITGD